MSEKKIDDGGAAFPCKHSDFAPADHGMTLRDWFAGRPMTEEEFRAVREEFWAARPEQPLAKTSEIRYWYADQMIAEKRRTEGGGK